MEFTFQKLKVTPFEIHRYIYNLKRDEPRKFKNVEFESCPYSKQVDDAIKEAVQGFIIKRDGITYSLTGYGKTAVGIVDEINDDVLDFKKENRIDEIERLKKYLVVCRSDRCEDCGRYIDREYYSECPACKMEAITAQLHSQIEKNNELEKKLAVLKADLKLQQDGNEMLLDKLDATREERDIVKAELATARRDYDVVCTDNARLTNPKIEKALAAISEEFIGVISEEIIGIVSPLFDGDEDMEVHTYDEFKDVICKHMTLLRNILLEKDIAKRVYNTSEEKINKALGVISRHDKIIEACTLMQYNIATIADAKCIEMVRNILSLHNDNFKDMINGKGKKDEMNQVMGRVRQTENSTFYEIGSEKARKIDPLKETVDILSSVPDTGNMMSFIPDIGNDEPENKENQENDA